MPVSYYVYYGHIHDLGNISFVPIFVKYFENYWYLPFKKSDRTLVQNHLDLLFSWGVGELLLMTASISLKFIVIFKMFT